MVYSLEGEGYGSQVALLPVSSPKRSVDFLGFALMLRNELQSQYHRSNTNFIVLDSRVWRVIQGSSQAKVYKYHSFFFSLLFIFVLSLPMKEVLYMHLLSWHIDFCFAYCLTKCSLNQKSHLIIQVPFVTNRKLICFSLSKQSS